MSNIVDITPSYAKFRDFANVIPSRPLRGTKCCVDVPEDEHKSLLNVLFGVDAVTNLPSSDIGMFMNKKLSSEVLSFVKDNLMQDVSSAAAVGVPVGVDDDVVLQLSRNNGESRDSYITRVRDYVSSIDSELRQHDLVMRANQSLKQATDLNTLNQ